MEHGSDVPSKTTCNGERRKVKDTGNNCEKMTAAKTSCFYDGRTQNGFSPFRRSGFVRRTIASRPAAVSAFQNFIRRKNQDLSLIWIFNG